MNGPDCLLQRNVLSEPEWIARADEKLTIPMSPGADSLNVTVSAGIVLHHFASR